MNIIIYMTSIAGAVATTGVMYLLVKKYSAVYVIVLTAGAGLVAAKLIVANDLSFLMSGFAIVGCGLVAGILTIPGVVLSEVESLEEEVAALKAVSATHEYGGR